MTPLAAWAQEAPAAPAPTYADLADLSEPANLVIKAQIRRQVALSPERSQGVQTGYVRLYVEAQTSTLIAGSSPIGEAIKYLVDVPLMPNGKPPKLKKQDVILFARAVPGRPGEIQLVTPTAQLPWSPELEARLRPILSELASPDAPPTVLGVRDALSIPGNLVGESETQMFLNTKDGIPVSITVVHRPGMTPVWGVSWSEIVDQAARPPARDTLAWYRIACFLPAQLPRDANLGRDGDSRAQAEEDYRFVQRALGPCKRNRS